MYKITIWKLLKRIYKTPINFNEGECATRKVNQDSSLKLVYWKLLSAILSYAACEN